MAKKPWRVRVLKRQEDWIEIVAESAMDAEGIAISRPQVISVFHGSTIPGDKVASDEPAAGVQENLF
jgi:hypothetical protein